ncbi:MAG: electron transfer flavoprotein subunit alpha/FixB family protein [Clostridiales bacterium]|nr:electron transfer flavoprotein subunit alpha/FixB family protein [Clostridiales bacterium]MBQ3321433.1 electron transfer flavoprotein subunit alpha/FixB family protein [Bacillota bacterium]
MKAKDIKKVLILDQGNPVAGQLLQKAAEVFGTDAVQYVVLKAHRTHNLVLTMMEETIREEAPELVLLGATALGEEIAPALGVRLGTGVAAHCVDIKVNEDGRLTFMIPAIGGRAVGEIFIPDAGSGRPAVATVKPGIFPQPEDVAFADKIPGCRIIDVDAMKEDGSIDPGEKVQGGFRMTQIVPRERSAGSITGADIILCGGYGLGSEGVWKKLKMLAQRLGGAAACTRAALDAEWGCSEDSMIGTSGKAVRPKVYIGFGISGAAHHLCGITGADTIISINNDKDADVFAASDYKGVFDAEQILDALLEMTE